MSNKEIPRHLSPHREAPNKHEKGGRKYKDWVHSESQKAEAKNLPFKFSVPKKAKANNTQVWCDNCGNRTSVTETTIAIICAQCGEMFRVSEKNKECDPNKTINVKIGGGHEDPEKL